MRTIDKTLIFDVAALTQIALQQKKTTTPRFKLPTFITTNLDSKDLREKYRDRIADRLNEMFDRIVFDNNTSYRLN